MYWLSITTSCLFELHVYTWMRYLNYYPFISGPNTFNENETIAKYEIMDGAPVRGERMLVQYFFCCGYSTTPGSLSVNFHIPPYKEAIQVLSKVLLRNHVYLLREYQLSIVSFAIKIKAFPRCSNNLLSS